MRCCKLFAPAILAALLLLSSAKGLVGPGDGEVSSRTLESGWRVLTKRNFSSEIRRHPHLLLMVTLPWCGESQSLMKEVSHLVADRQEELDYLKLRVVYRNSEKLLADVLGAAEGITLFYYHHSTSYKYQGRLRAQNILSSIYHFMSLQIEEIPLKPLHTKDDLENFLRSTDKAVILMEFCGWSAKLLHKGKNGNNETLLPVQNTSVDILEEKVTRDADRTLAFDNKNQKGLENEELTCGIEKVFAGSPWLGGFTWANQSASQATENRRTGSAGSGMSCMLEEFQQFETFFSNFTSIAREYYLPPERQRFAVISERSLVPFLGIDNPKTWLLMLHFSGCVNCSIVLQDGDDLRTFLQTDNSLVMELDDDGHNLKPAFPANMPSIILFVDRSSDSSEVREESKSSLEILRRFAQHSQLSYQMVRGPDIINSESSSAGLSGTSSTSMLEHAGDRTTRAFAAPKTVKIKDKMAVMIINKGESISLENENAVTDTQGNSAYDILAHLLHQRNPAFETKEKKISLLAKEAGFQLLSDDFEVQVIESLPSQKENDQLDEMETGAVTSPDNHFFEFPQESTEHGISMSDGDLLKDIGITTGIEGKQPEITDIENVLQKNQETVPYSGSNTSKFATKLAKETSNESDVSKCIQYDDNDNNCMQKELGSFTCQAENSFHFEEESYVSKGYNEPEHAEKTCSKGVLQNLSDALSSVASDGDDEGEVKLPLKTSKLGEPHDQHPPFWGSVFFSDGGCQLLRSLTAVSKIPSLVILDPVLQQHYVFSEKTDISYSSLVNFVDDFLNGRLTPYRMSASHSASPRASPRPPFVNLDFHEADSIPRVTANTFCELVVGYKHCEIGHELLSSNIQNFGSAWKMDVLVLFSTSWCGFCQRMELIVREVNRAFKSFKEMLNSQSRNMDTMHIQDNVEDTVMNGLPSVFLMDCTLNECGSFLTPICKKELYPALLLFPAENKSAISYEGDMSVVNIIEFLATHASNSQYMNRHKGFLWTRTSKESKSRSTLHDVSSLSIDERAPYSENKYNEFLSGTAVSEDNRHPAESHTTNGFHDDGQHVVPGSVLAATDKLLDAFPFDNSTILIITVDQSQGFQGVIINKRISWGVFKELEELNPLRQVPLFFGGPVRARGLPLVSLARKPIEGFTKVMPGLYFGDPIATGMAIERIKSGEQAANDCWFFLGYSSWGWTQLFDELEEGAWNLSSSPVGHLDWPDN